ncbi:MAG: Ig domain-containing protein [Bacteroidales bacterium]|nr:Ig domain-containing protein [Bacteroidales bacterium]
MKRILAFLTSSVLATAFLASCVETPAEVAVTGVRLSDTEIELLEGQTHNLTATVLPEDATNKGVTWTSAVPNVATVSDDGTVIAMAMGASTITVTTVDGGFRADCAVIVKMRVIPVESISLNYDKIGIEEGSGVYLSATVLPTNATNKNVIWSASPENVISVDNIGKVTGLIPGEGDVTATTEDGGFTATCHIIVNAVTVNAESVTLDRETLELTEGETAVLTATVLPENTTDKTVQWRTIDEAVAMVDQEGKVTAVGAGKTLIVASCGGIEAACEVTVKKVEVTGLTIEPASVTLAEGKTFQLSATVSPANADQTVEWVSYDTNVAKVDANGLVTAVKEGTTKIFARSQAFTDVSASCEITVIKDPTLRGISINPSELTLTVGQAQTLQVVYTPEYATNKKVSWSTDNADVASVSAEGEVTAKEEGVAIVTATSDEGGLTASCKVMVGKTTGTRVYCYINNYLTSKKILYLNGTPDPLSGAFEVIINDASYSFAYLIGMRADGHDLYTLEWYQSSISSGNPLFLCKNRKPLYRLDEYFKDPDNVHGMAARDGKVAFTYYSTSGENNYLIIVDPDGTVTKSDIPGDYKNMYDMPCAFSPSGDLYIAPDFKDPFGDRHLGVYKYGTDKEWSYYDLPKHEYPGQIDISDEGDVYVFTLYQDDDYYAVLYKNGEEYSVTDQYNKYVNIDLSIAGGHIYTVALDEDEKKATERCDGNLLRTVNIDSGLHSMHATTSGDVYLATGKRIYKNDAVLFTVPGEIHYISYFCVVE